jgi:4-hydroxy-tetrahydrodipicolinate synthase
MLACGGAGVISVVANIWPQKMVAMIKAFNDGDCAKALVLHETLLPVTNAMFIETNPGPVKTAMNYLGLAAGSLRLPLWEMEKANKANLISVLEENKVDKAA